MKTPRSLAQFPALALALLVAVARSGAAEPALVSEARQAIAENIPEVAIEKLRQAIESLPIGSEGRPDALALLAEAQLNAGQAAEALGTLSQITAGHDARLVRLRALTFVALARWDEALAQFEALGAREDATAAIMGRVQCLQALGRREEAVELLKALAFSDDTPAALRLQLAALLVDLDRIAEALPILRSTRAATATDGHWRRYIEARIHLHEKKPLAALDDLAPLIGDGSTPPPAGLTHDLRAAALLAEADARLAASGPETAEKVLEAFIRQNPASPHIEAVFHRLDQIYSLDPSTDEGPLSRMAAELPAQTAALAQFHLARALIRAKRSDLADAALKKFLARFPEHRLTPSVHAMLAENAQARGDLAGAETALDAASRTAQTEKQRGEFALQTALLNLQQGEFVRASAGFNTAALRSPSLKVAARYDAALAWLRQKNFARFAEDFAAFTTEFPDRTLAGNLRIEEGLVRARTGDAQAGKSLKAFLVNFKDHPRHAEAQLALAELALNDGNITEAQKLQRAVVADDPSPEMREQAEYLGIFLDDAKAPRNEEQAIARARDFIRQHPSSAVIGEVRMKLGEIYFRREDYLKAEEQFETLARERADGPHATAALFLAGQCSMKLLNTESLNRALELFGRVIEKHGALETHARIQQAIVKTKLGAPDDAVKIYDSIVSAQPPVEAELRLAALTGKADNLVTLGKTDAKQFAAAIATYDQIIATEKAPPSWRNQASYKKGKTLELQDQSDAALVIFYDILQRTATGPRETFWFAKAGFDAAALVESRQQWKSAIGIYEKMAAIPGPHAEQARQRVRKLRLEHFLWD